MNIARWEFTCKLPKGKYRFFVSATDSAGNVFVTGWFQDTVDFDPGTGFDTHSADSGVDSGDIYLSKFNSVGSFQWALTWGSADVYADEALGASVDSSGNVLVTGFIQNQCDLDPGPGVDLRGDDGLEGTFVSKFNNDGTYLWGRVWSESWGAGVAADANNNAFAAGWYTTTVDFDPGTGVENHYTNGTYDVFLVKLLPDGYW